MARNPADIQAEIALTREVIARRLDALERRAPHPALLILGLVVAGALTGVVLTRLPVLTVLRIGIRTAQVGVGAASAVAMLRRVPEAGRVRTGAADVNEANHRRAAWRRAS